MRVFGRLANGSEVNEVVLERDGLTVRVLDWGAVIRDVRLAGVDHPLVLGFDKIEDYVAHSPHFGAVAGRCANRIADGRFTLDGVDVQLTRNERDTTHLHGGHLGFSRRLWSVEDFGADHVRLAIRRPDGDEGYPGEVAATVTYSLETGGTLRMEATVTTDKPTLVNLAQHSYFNLDGGDDILDHELRIFADHVTPADARDIPTGERLPVTETVYDFTAPRPIRLEDGGEQVAYDINYVIDEARASAPRPAARMHGPVSGVTLDVASTEPGLQFYGGFKLAIPVPGLEGRRYGPSAGCCFEPQVFPDAINQPSFPSAVLRPGETYAQTSLFRFTRG